MNRTTIAAPEHPFSHAPDHIIKRFTLATCFLGKLASLVLELNYMITIGVLAYLPSQRHRDLLDGTLASLKQQQGVPKFQVILIDNGNFGLADWLKDRARMHGCTYFRRPNSEIAAARDWVMQLDSKYVGFVDSDVELPTNWIMRMSAELDSDRELMAVASSNRPPMGESLLDDALRAMFQVPWVFLSSPQSLQVKSGIVKVAHLPACAVIYRRDAVLKVGGFDCNFTSVCEDLELSQRLNQVGYLAMVGGHEVTHRQDRELSFWLKRMFRYGWGQVEVMRKHPRQMLSRKAAMIPLFFLGLFVIFLAIQGETQPALVFYGLYFTLTAGGIFWRNRGQNWRTLSYSVLVALGTHVCYLLGMIAGAFGLKRNPSPESTQTL